VTFGWGTAFATTLLIETPVYVAGLRRDLGVGRAAAVALVLNVATHPLAFALGTPGSPVRFVAVEGGVWVAEALLLWALARWLRPPPPALARAALLSAAANALSAGAGLLLGG
jgi:hypothetical protein